jgi:hypothetical protein
VAGSALGLVGGAVLASRLPGEDTGAIGAWPVLEDLGVRPSFTVLPWADEENRPGVWMELRLDEIPRG